MYLEIIVVVVLAIASFIKIICGFICSSDDSVYIVDFEFTKGFPVIGYPFFDFPEEAKSVTKIGYWPGTYKGCIINYDVSIYYGYCPDMYEIISPINPINFYYWKGKAFQYDNSPNISSYYDYFNLLNLSVSSNEECPSDLKQCGLLDTMNNKMCIDKDKECPINMIIMKNTSEPPTEYNYTFKNVSFDDGSYLFYTNEAIDQHIIGNITVNDGDLCINPNDFFTNNEKYILEKYDEKCRTINEIQYDRNFIKIDTIDKYSLYSENKILSSINELPDYPIEKLKTQFTSLYYRPFIGFNKTCINKVKQQTYQSSDEIRRKIMNLTTSLLIVSIIDCSFVLSLQVFGSSFVFFFDKQKMVIIGIVLLCFITGILNNIVTIFSMQYYLIKAKTYWFDCSDDFYANSLSNSFKENKTALLIISFVNMSYFIIPLIYLPIKGIIYLVDTKDERKKKRIEKEKEREYKKRQKALMKDYDSIEIMENNKKDNLL